MRLRELRTIALAFLIICGLTPSALGQRDLSEQEIQWYNAAQNHYAAGRYEPAIVLLEKAYKATGAPRFLFNLAANHHGMGHCEQARDYYEQYLSYVSDGPQKENVELSLTNIYEHCGQRKIELPAAAPAPPETPLPPKPSQLRLLKQKAPRLEKKHQASSQQGSSGQPLGLALRPIGNAARPASLPPGDHWQRTTRTFLLGSGAVAGFAATATFLLMSKAEKDINDRRNGRNLGIVWLDEAQNSRKRDFARYRAVTWGLGLGSGLLIAAGTTLWVLNLTPDTTVTLGAAGLPGFSLEQQF